MPAHSTRKTMSQTVGKVTFHREAKFYELILKEMRREYHPCSAWCFSRGDHMIDEYIVEHEEYVGIGSGAFSYLDGVLYSSTFSINRYIDYVRSGGGGIVNQRRFHRPEQLRYDFLINLFGLALNGETMSRKYGEAWQRALWKEFLFFRLLGALAVDGDVYRLTERGMYYWVVMMREFLCGVNNFREDMRAHIRAELNGARSETARVSVDAIGGRSCAEPSRSE
jgi:coproporphyrinogen III oxidase-like Fe-S oxidoreductase